MVNVMKTEEIRGDWAGRVIDGKYPLLRWLGGSDSNGVFLTEIEDDRSQKAAIRLIAVNQQESSAQIALWTETSNLAHSNLTRLFQTGRCQSGEMQLVYAVTDYAEENLAEILPVRALTTAETREMFGPVLDALSYLHGKGFVHGRLKPSNVLVVNDQVKLSIEDVQAAGPVGKRNYAVDIHDAPECAAGPISPAVDIWSLGVLLVETLTQHPPVWNGKAENDPVVPGSMQEPFACIARGALHTDPTRRCTLSDIGDRLRASHAPQESSAPQSEKAAPAKSRLPLAIAAVVVAVVLIAFFLIRSHREELPQVAVDQQSVLAKPFTPGTLYSDGVYLAFAIGLLLWIRKAGRETEEMPLQ